MIVPITNRTMLLNTVMFVCNIDDGIGNYSTNDTQASRRTDNSIIECFQLTMS